MTKGQHQGNGEDPSTVTKGQEVLVDPASIAVDEDLRHLVPKHRKSEVALLERSLIEDQGCREALHVWEHEGKLVLLDGHTRRELCIKHGFQVRAHPVQLADKEAAKAYVKKVQLGRRNTPAQADAYLRGSHYNELKQEHGGDRRSKQQADALEDTAAKLAKEYEVSASTIDRDGQFARLLDKVLQEAGMAGKRWELLSGDVKLNRGAVKKLSELQGKELKKQIEYTLKYGRLPRKERPAEPAGSAKEVAKTRAESFVSKLKAKDEKLPVAVLKEMAFMLGFKLVETAAGKAAKEPAQQAAKAKKE